LKETNPVTENLYAVRSISSAMILGSLLTFLAAAAKAQTRGKYAPGINATNSGVQPEPGLTYSNVFLDYTFNELHGADGQRLQANPGFHDSGGPQRLRMGQQ